MYFEARHVFGMLLSASSHLGISLQLVFVFCVCEILEKESDFISRIYKLVPKHWLKPKIDKMRQQDES